VSPDRFSNAPVQVLVRTLNRILFPALSRVQGRDETVRRVLKITLRALGLTLFPILLFLATNARLTLDAFFDRDWLAAAPVLTLLCLYALLHGLYRTFTSVFRGIDRPGRETIANTVYIAVFLLLALPLVYRHGLIGMPVALCASILGTFVISMGFLRDHVGYGYGNLLNDVGPILLACSTFPLVRILLGRLGPGNLSPGAELPLLLALSAAGYLGVLAVFEFGLNYGLRRNLRDITQL